MNYELLVSLQYNLSEMRKEERYQRILDHFRQQMPEVNTELEFGSVFQLLVAVVLSAQCTDKRVNQVTPELFAHYPDARTMATAEPEDLLEYISSVSYPNAKARHLGEGASVHLLRGLRPPCARALRLGDLH